VSPTSCQTQHSNYVPTSRHQDTVHRDGPKAPPHGGEPTCTQCRSCKGSYKISSKLAVHTNHRFQTSQQSEAQTQLGQNDLFYYQYNALDYSESDDGDLIAMHDVALRKAASLEALQAYGGCFVSGFLAMQDPLPWASSPTATITSRSSFTSAGSPRPDSDTLSRVDVRELNDERKSNWRSMRKLRNMARKSKN
jgi:hypothetical protein